MQRENRSRGSAFIHEHFRAGTPLKISRPINAFRLSRNQPHTLLVAGGIGITPMVAMARSLRVRQAPFSMMYAGLKRSTMAYAGDLEVLCGDSLILHEAERDGVPDLKGLLAAQPRDIVVYICGPGAMMRPCARPDGRLGGMTRASVSKSSTPRISLTTKTFWSGFLLVGPSKSARERQFWTRWRAPVSTPCRLPPRRMRPCVTDVVGCDGLLDHRDRYFSEAEHGQGKQITICCSRSRDASSSSTSKC